MNTLLVPSYCFKQRYGLFSYTVSASFVTCLRIVVSVDTLLSNTREKLSFGVLN